MKATMRDVSSRIVRRPFSPLVRRRRAPGRVIQLQGEARRRQVRPSTSVDERAQSARTGENNFEVMVMSGGQPVTDADVSVEFFMAAMPAMNMPEMRNSVPLKHGGGGSIAAPASDDGGQLGRDRERQARRAGNRRQDDHGSPRR